MSSCPWTLKLGEIAYACSHDEGHVGRVHWSRELNATFSESIPSAVYGMPANPDSDVLTPEQGATANTDPQHQHPFPGNELIHLAAFGNDSEHNFAPPSIENRIVVTDENQACVVSSRRVNQPLYTDPKWHTHRPVIDLDFETKLIPSSTPGHYHLYLDRNLSWNDYKTLLLALADAGIISRGYAVASIERGHSCVRVPWLKKGDPSPELPVVHRSGLPDDAYAKLRELSLRSDIPHDVQEQLKRVMAAPIPPAPPLAPTQRPWTTGSES